MPRELIIFVGNLCFTLILLSFMVRKMLYLRLLSICAGFASVFYNYFVTNEPLWTPITWNIVFMITNLFHVALIIWEMREVHLSGDELYVYEKFFKQLSPGEFKKMMKISREENCHSQVTLINEGEEIDRLILLLDGEIDVVHNDQKLASLGRGKFIGEMSFLTNQKTRANCISNSTCRYYSWPKIQLKEFLYKNPHKLAAFQSAIGAQIICELMAKSEQNAKFSDVA